MRWCNEHAECAGGVCLALTILTGSLQAQFPSAPWKPNRAPDQNFPYTKVTTNWPRHCHSYYLDKAFVRHPHSNFIHDSLIMKHSRWWYSGIHRLLLNSWEILNISNMYDEKVRRKRCSYSDREVDSYSPHHKRKRHRDERYVIHLISL